MTIGDFGATFSLPYGHLDFTVNKFPNDQVTVL